MGGIGLEHASNSPGKPLVSAGGAAESAAFDRQTAEDRSADGQEAACPAGGGRAPEGTAQDGDKAAGAAQDIGTVAKADAAAVPTPLEAIAQALAGLSADDRAKLAAMLTQADGGKDGRP